jgi:uncharacterized membrane protein YebE (DUF533 family)
MALTDSQMAMWETVVALVHADGEVHTEEDKFLTERFEKLPVTPEQKQELLKHIDKPGNPRELFQQITEPADRSQLIYFARLLFHSDGDFAAQEKHILDLLQSDVMSHVDMTAAMHKVDQIVIDFEKKEQARRDSQPLHRKIINAIVFWQDLDSLD